MKSMEREKFEESWKDAFDGAGMPPPDKVWTNIELDLEKASGGKLKRRLMFYQMLAAACVVFAMAIGGAGYYYGFRSVPGTTSDALAATDQIASPNPVATAEQPGESHASDLIAAQQEAQTPAADLRPSARNTIAGPGHSPESNVQSESNAQQQRARNDRDSNTGVTAIDHRPFEGTLATAIESPGREDQLPLRVTDNNLSPLFARREVTLTFEEAEPEIDPVVSMLAMLERREREVRTEEERERNYENLWTSVGFSAGSFNTVRLPSASSGGSLYSTALAGPIVESESKASGVAYSMGLNVGTRISERWVLQGGVNYLTQSTEYTANSVVADGPGFAFNKASSDSYKPATTNAVINADEYELRNKIVYSAPYSVNNSMRYLSIPLQAGYLLVDKEFGLQLNAGVATDLFLQNTVKGEGDQLAETTASGGADSPFRSVNLSGLVGTEVSYRIGSNYRVSLNPGIRYPFNTIYKSEFGVESSPLTFDVGLRFRYIFN